MIYMDIAQFIAYGLSCFALGFSVAMFIVTGRK